MVPYRRINKLRLMNVATTMNKSVEKNFFFFNHTKNEDLYEIAIKSKCYTLLT